MVYRGSGWREYRAVKLEKELTLGLVFTMLLAFIADLLSFSLDSCEQERGTRKKDGVEQ